MKKFLNSVLVGLLLAVPVLSHAHFLWATLDPATKKVEIGLQEYPTENPVPLRDRASLVKAWTASKTDVALKTEGNWIRGTSPSDAVAISLDYGVLDRKSEGRGVFWLNYFAKAATSVEASQTKVDLPVEVMLARNGSDFVATVYRKGKLAPHAEVGTELPDGKPGFEGKTGLDGKVTFPATNGNIAVRALVVENEKGTHDGKAYESVRSYCTLTILQGPQVKPLMRQLSEAFGKNHIIVGETEFVNTLMAGKLTKEQLLVHFQQRGLVHEAVDQILTAAAPSVPYGEDQKHVLNYLKEDMKTANMPWPSATDARPLTQSFLNELRESAKKGPYFALGVLHVYYGGVTHGGRDIGAIIEETLKVHPTYYLKIDGYSSYAEKVNAIKDSEAQKEMIRGGVAVYKYIIDSSNEAVFKMP